MSQVNTSENYIPMDQWPDVTQMVSGFGAPDLRPTEALVGTSLHVEFTDAPARDFEFLTKEKVRVASATPQDISGEFPYRAVELREGVFFIDVVIGEGTSCRNYSFVYSVETLQVTLADSFLFNRAGEVRTGTVFLHGTTGGGEVVARPRTDELVGLRIYYRYSPTEHYEHIYLSSGTFVWHCVRGGEKGIADADETASFSLGEGLVIFHWREKFLPVESFLVVDFENRRSIGRMFCWDAPTMKPVHLPFDSEFTILNRTEYPTE